MHIILRSCRLFSPSKKVASPPLDSEPLVMSEGGSKIPFFTSGSLRPQLCGWPHVVGMRDSLCGFESPGFPSVFPPVTESLVSVLLKTLGLVA